MKINGTLINYYFHCKRQCYLFGNRINLEDNSEDVMIGRVLHEIKNNSSKTEVKFENISLDKITDKYVVEMKKSDSDIEAAKMQLLYYLKILKEKGIEREGKLTFCEKNTNQKVDIIKLDDENIKLLTECENSIYDLINSDEVPPVQKQKRLQKMCIL